MTQQTRAQLEMLWPAEECPEAPPAALPKGYTLRTFREGDQEAVIELLGLVGFEDWTRQRLDDTLQTVLPDGLFVAEHGATGVLAATAMATHRPAARHPFGGELGWVASRPDHAGRGLGFAVCAAATARFLAAGYRRIYLKTDDWRLAAIKTYLRLGYRPLLFSPGMPDRWRAVCQRLDWPFTPGAWPRMEVRG